MKSAEYDQLLPCPFCGSEPHSKNHSYVYCKNTSCVIYGHDVRREEWNKRDAQQDDSKVIRDLLKSSDSSWYEHAMGHDWRQAVDAAEIILTQGKAVET